jgi:hypothetical protein
MPPADRGPRPQSPPGCGLRRNTTHVVKRELKGVSVIDLAALPKVPGRVIA